MADEPDNFVTELMRRRRATLSRPVLALSGVLLAASAFAHEDAHGFAAGAPGDAKAPARTVEVAMSEDSEGMRFTPARIAVRPGEQVRFVLHNRGQFEHEFVLGTKADNREHAKMMAQMPGMKHADGNAVTLVPGASADLLWRFSHAGDFEFACLIPGHYEAGMHGEAVVR